MPHLRVISFEQLTNLRDLLCDLQVLLTRYRRRFDDQHKLSPGDRKLWGAQIASVSSHLFHRVRETLPAEEHTANAQRMQDWEDAYYFGDRIAKPLPKERPTAQAKGNRARLEQAPGPAPHDPERKTIEGERSPFHLDPDAAFRARLLLSDAQSLISDYERRNDPDHQLTPEQRRQWSAEAVAVLAALIKAFESYSESAMTARLIDVPLTWNRQVAAGERLVTEKDTPAKRQLLEITQRYRAHEVNQRRR